MHGLQSLINGLFALLIFPPLLLAQTSTVVTGVVEDQTGIALSGAKATLLRQDTAATQSTASRQDGTFVFEDVSQGSDVLKIEMGGFETYQKALTVDSQELKQLRIRLRVAVEEDVTVEAESADKLSTSGSDAICGLQRLSISRPFLAGSNARDVTASTSLWMCSMRSTAPTSPALLAF